jgi:hypothetical protein
VEAETGPERVNDFIRHRSKRMAIHPNVAYGFMRLCG